MEGVLGLGHRLLPAPGGCALQSQLAYLGIREAQHRGQLLSVWLGHILLNLKSFLQAFPLQVGEDCARP